VKDFFYLTLAAALAALLTLGIGCESKSNHSTKASAQGAAAQTQQPVPSKRAPNRNAPAITDLSFEPSTFAKCGESIEICVQAIDPDGDAMQATWSGPAGSDVTFKTVESKQEGNTLRECVSVKPPAGESRFEVRIVESNKADDVAESDSMEFPVRAAGDC
jgi:hypothetical protein